MTSTQLVNNCAQNSMELITPILKAKLFQSSARELAVADTQANSPSTTSVALSPAPESIAVPNSTTINSKIEDALREHLRAIGKLFIDQNLNPADSLTNIMLQSKLRQFKSLQVMKTELEAV